MTLATLCFGDDAVPNIRFSPTTNDHKIRLPLEEIVELEEGETEADSSCPCDREDTDETLRLVAADTTDRKIGRPLTDRQMTDRQMTDQQMADQLDAICQQLNESSAIDSALAVLPFYRDDPQGDPQPIGYYVVACPLCPRPDAAASNARFVVIHRIRVNRFADDCKALRVGVLRYAGVEPLAATPQPARRLGLDRLAPREAALDPWQSTIELLRAAIATAARLTKSVPAQESFEAAA
jgi:hypothetical protein